MLVANKLTLNTTKLKIIIISPKCVRQRQKYIVNTQLDLLLNWLRVLSISVYISTIIYFLKSVFK